MMNKMPSTKTHMLKFLAVTPVAAVLLLAFNGVAKPQTDDAASNEAVGYTKVGPAIYIKSAPTFTNACWTAPHTLTITPLEGDADVYQLDNEQDLAMAYNKYGLYLPDNEMYDKVLAGIPGSTNEKRPQLVDEYKDFYARNPQVRKLEWTASNEIIVRLETTEEIFNLDNKKSRAAAEKKYGKLPTSPPPAQVVTQEEFDTQSGKGLQGESEKVIIPADMNYYQDRNNLPVEYTNFLKSNPSVAKLGWKIDPEKGPHTVVLFLRSGSTEMYNMNDSKSMATAESRYGELPGLLPPPPPVRISQVPPTQTNSDSNLPDAALYYIDGVEASKEAAGKLDPKEIHSVNAFKGEQAVKALGDKAAHGVISITTEKNKDSPQVTEFNKKFAAQK